MRILLFFPTIVLMSLSSHHPFSFRSIHQKIVIDSGIINHVLDGSTNEWPDNKFESDKETNIKYAIDNDTSNMFVAMRIPDFRMQMKMMRQGMNLYIDMKGKRKEGHGIEFPVKKDFSSSFGSGGLGNQQTNQSDQQTNERQQSFDKKAARSSMALNLIYMKIFGFGDGDPQEQGLSMEGSANISFQWDSSDVMHIEYEIPLKMLDGSVSSLNQKNISIGWKINGIDASSATTSSTSLVGVPSSGGRGGNRGGSSGFNRVGTGGSSDGFSPNDRDKMMQEQNFWTKYTFIFPAGSK